MPDFDVTVVYEGNIESQEWLYYEQDGFVVTLGNWLNGRMSGGQIESFGVSLSHRKLIIQIKKVRNNV